VEGGWTYESSVGFYIPMIWTVGIILIDGGLLFVSAPALQAATSGRFQRMFTKSFEADPETILNAVVLDLC
jgi:hypothetical protein